MAKGATQTPQHACSSSISHISQVSVQNSDTRQQCVMKYQ